jgi:hypothetical protein
MSEEEVEFIPARGRGAEKKYQPWMCEKIIEVARAGGFHAAMMNAIDVARATFYAYKKDIPEFAEALEKADMISLEMLEDKLVKGMSGEIKNYSFSANAFTLSNKYKSLYPRAGSGDTTEVTINNLNLTPDQLQNKIAQKYEKLKSLGLSFPFHEQKIDTEDFNEPE